MAKQFEIRFDESDESKAIVSITAGFDETGKAIVEKKEKGEVEKMIAKNLFQIAARHQKEMGSFLECKDCISQIDNLKDGALVLFTEQDLKYMHEGFTKTAGDRPQAWLEYGENIFRQIKTPVEHKE